MATNPRTRAEAGLLGQTVVVVGGSSSIGLETARQACTGARSPERLDSVAREP